MKERLEAVLKEAVEAARSAADAEAAMLVKARYLGKKSEITALLKGLGALKPEERKAAGEAVNKVKDSIEAEVASRLAAINDASRAARLEGERLDATLPGRKLPAGTRHPVAQVMEEIESVFTSLGFSIAEGPEVELDYYNFEALNIPKDHPAREMQDTFYVAGGTVLRTHTSPVQIRVMEKKIPPLRVIAPGTVYRRDSDVTHTPMFHQVEGFMVDEGVTMANLKGVLSHFLQSLFGKETAVRFRPSFFPFTEPSAEADIRCVICRGSGCRVCKGSGWLEVLGCGMIHPRVFEAVKYDYSKYSGFAFGIGVERMAMLKYGIDDLRLFFENDLAFLRQF